jgi:hypothetical protein
MEMVGKRERKEKCTRSLCKDGNVLERRGKEDNKRKAKSNTTP